MARPRPAIIVSAILATAALALTIDEFARPQPPYFDWPGGGIGAGTLVLPALITATWWLVRDTRQQPSANVWAKSALALAISLPLAWIATAKIVFAKLRGIPDGDMPEGLVDRMNADVFQMQFAALLVTVGVLVCIAMADRRVTGGARYEPAG
jgi:hypothetical protein